MEVSTPSSVLLRSSKQGLLQVPLYKWAKSTTAHTHAFSVVSPTLWNGLPGEVRKAPILQAELFKRAVLLRRSSSKQAKQTAIMAKQTYQAGIQFLMVSFIVQAVGLQAIGDLSLNSTDLPSMVTPHELRKTTISRSPGMLSVSSHEAATKTTPQHTDTSIAAVGNTISFSSLLHHSAQTTQSSHTEAKGPSEVTAETTTAATAFPTESFISSNSTYQPSSEDSKATSSAITQKLTAQPSTATSLSSGKVLHSIPASQLPAAGVRIKNSEIILTVCFTLILTLTILGLLVCILNKYRKQRTQYSHHQLYDNSFDTVDRYATPDDTLVISGGLYDAPRIYNSSVTAYEDEEFQTDHLPFSAQPAQFKLEFFGEKENGISLTSETLQVPTGGL